MLIACGLSFGPAEIIVTAGRENVKRCGRISGGSKNRGASPPRRTRPEFV